MILLRQLPAFIERGSAAQNLAENQSSAPHFCCAAPKLMASRAPLVGVRLDP
jgi:hypothetical protein